MEAETDVESCIRRNLQWSKLPKDIQQLLGGSPKEYDKLILEYSIKNQLRYSGNLVKTVKKNEEQYYEMLLTFSREHLMLFPYHLSDIIVSRHRITPFHYYLKMVETLILLEKSYDSLPNFTAADGVRLLGIGRNEYIDIMNKCRSSKKLANKKIPPHVLPAMPQQLKIEPWWIVQRGHILESDVKMLGMKEKQLIDRLMDEKLGIIASTLDQHTVRMLFKLGLIYFDVPIDEDDILDIPRLENFIMNRVTGDFLEKLLYQIFPAVDGRRSVVELQISLNKDMQLLKSALSVFCRLGIAQKKNPRNTEPMHPSWVGVSTPSGPRPSFPVSLENSFIATPGDDDDEIVTSSGLSPSPSIMSLAAATENVTATEETRIAFLFDSTLTAFLMMGNKSADLKAHAVTLFEVGKLGDEALPCFLSELEKLFNSTDIDSKRSSNFARILVTTMQYLRKLGKEVDMVRCESLMGLETAVRIRLLKSTYKLIISVAPLTSEAIPLNCSIPPTVGAPIAEVNSPWFSLFLYNLIQCGPVSLLLTKGTKLQRLPRELKGNGQVLISQWSHDPSSVASDCCLMQLSEALQRAPVFLQEFSSMSSFVSTIAHVPFPDLTLNNVDEALTSESSNSKINSSGPLNRHPHLMLLHSRLRLNSSCGYVTFMKKSNAVTRDKNSNENLKRTASSDDGSLSFNPNEFVNFDYPSAGDLTRDPRRTPSTHAETETVTYDEWLLFDCAFGLPLFDLQLNETLLNRLESVGCLKSEWLENLQWMNRNLSMLVLDFISKFRHSDFVGSPNSSADPSVMFPSVNLIFRGTGDASLWNV